MEPPPVPTPLDWHCAPKASHRGDPPIALLGEGDEITATIYAEVMCRGGICPTHTTIILTGTDDDVRVSPLKRLAHYLNLVDAAFSDESLYQHVGIVLAERGSARRALPITDDQDSVLRAMRIWHKEEAADVAGVKQAIRESRRALRLAASRLSRETRLAMDEAAIIVGDLGGQERCPSLVREAKRLAADDVLIITACESRDCLKQCHRDLARSSRYAYELRNTREFHQIFGRVIDRCSGTVVVKLLGVETTIGEGFEYVEDSADPPLSTHEGALLGWSTSFVPRSGVTFTYRLRRTDDEPGSFPIAERHHCLDTGQPQSCGECRCPVSRSPDPIATALACAFALTLAPASFW